jgi:hypothetical protein
VPRLRRETSWLADVGQLDIAPSGDEFSGRCDQLRDRVDGYIGPRAFAFPKERKEPLTDASHVRSAIARFDQVEGVTDAERDEAWKRIQQAAKRFGVEVSESDGHELFLGGQARKP